MEQVERDKLDEYRDTKKEVAVIFNGGHHEFGIIIAHDVRTILFKRRSDGSESLFYKHAISTVKPAGEVRGY